MRHIEFLSRNRETMSFLANWQRLTPRYIHEFSETSV